MKKIYSILIILACLVLANQVQADFEVSKSNLAKRNIFNAFDNKISIKVLANTFKLPVKVDILEKDSTDYVLPSGYAFDSAIYEYKVSDNKAYNPKKLFYLTMRYDVDYIDFANDYIIDDQQNPELTNYGFIAATDYITVSDYVPILSNDYNELEAIDYTQLAKDTNFDRAIWYWDITKESWQRVKSYNYFATQIVTTTLNKSSAIIAILKKTDLMTEGRASWYKYKGCDCAASPDYPKGTKLKVTNTDNGKSVVVTINDWGPERDLFPNRVIDLDVTAFKKIANKRLGTCPVEVELYNEK